MNALNFQKFLLEKDPSRRELLSYIPQSTKNIRIGVYRNHSFELVEHSIGAYLDFAGLNATFVYSDYDDSLSFVNFDCSVDMALLWLDLSRYKNFALQDFLQNRIDFLKKIFPKPILFVGVCGSVDVNGVTQVNLNDVEEELGGSFLDDRISSITGTRLSAKALTLTSKYLGLRYIPSVISPALKAIVVDLDNTLYQGILGEDGIDDLVLTEGHRKLQTFLKEKAKEGWFLCALSKNDSRDVDDLWKIRTDFPLKKDDFTFVYASWDEKASGMKEIVKKLNIGFDSVLFLDDNLGELMAMEMAFPQIHLLQALDDAECTADMLSFYPGLLKTSIKAEDSLRKQDTQANEIRQEMQKNVSKEDYVRSLQIKIKLCVDAEQYASRISELANKTNQFIFAYRRYGLEEITALMKRNDAVVVSAILSDKLSDSGTVAVCVGEKEGDVLNLRECFVSCRALGRGIDDVLVLGMIRLIADILKTNKLNVSFTKGERNVPAEKFVSDYLSKYVNNPSIMDLSYDASLVEIQIQRG